MSQPEKLNTPPPGSDPLAAVLAALKPAAADLNRNGLMYAAGAESRRGVIRLWQAAAGFMAAVGFTAGMFFRPGGVERETIVYVEVPAPASALPEPSPAPGVVAFHRPPPPTPYGRAWLQFRSDVLAAGLSVLPGPVRADEKP